MYKYLYNYNNIFKKDFFSQENFFKKNFTKNKDKYPKIEKVLIQFSFKRLNFKSNFYLMFFSFLMELITNQKTCFGFSKKDVTFWNVRKNNMVSIYITLRGLKLFSFLERLMMLYFPYSDNYNNQKQKEFDIFNSTTNKNIKGLIIDFTKILEIENEINKHTDSLKNDKTTKFRVIIVFSKNHKPKNNMFLLNFFQIPFSKIN